MQASQGEAIALDASETKMDFTSGSQISNTIAPPVTTGANATAASASTPARPAAALDGQQTALQLAMGPQQGFQPAGVCTLRVHWITCTNSMQPSGS